MSSFFAAQIAPSGAVIEAVEPVDFNRWVLVSTGGVSIAFVIGFTEEETPTGFRVDQNFPASFVLPAGRSLWIDNSNVGDSAYVLVSGSPS
jgi:hypothetical protein